MMQMSSMEDNTFQILPVFFWSLCSVESTKQCLKSEWQRKEGRDEGTKRSAPKRSRGGKEQKHEVIKGVRIRMPRNERRAERIGEGTGKREVGRRGGRILNGGGGESVCYVWGGRGSLLTPCVTTGSPLGKYKHPERSESKREMRGGTLTHRWRNMKVIPKPLQLQTWRFVCPCLRVCKWVSGLCYSSCTSVYQVGSCFSHKVNVSNLVHNRHSSRSSWVFPVALLRVENTNVGLENVALTISQLINHSITRKSACNR